MKHIVRTICVTALAMTAAGCIDFDGPPAQITTTDQELNHEADYLSVAAVRPAEEPQGPTAVESALVWSEKYSQTVEKLVRLQQENRQLSEQTRQAIGENGKLKKELDQYQKELGEANEMLLEMKTELERWQSDVLGFREEMRKAQEAQLIALRKVLELLGGEAPMFTETALSAANETERTER